MNENEGNLIQQIYNDVHSIKDDLKGLHKDVQENKIAIAEGFAKSTSEHESLKESVHRSDETQNNRLKEHGEQIDNIVHNIGERGGDHERITTLEADVKSLNEHRTEVKTTVKVLYGLAGLALGVAGVIGVYITIKGGLP